MRGLFVVFGAWLPLLATIAAVACPLFIVGLLVDSFALRLACKPWPHLALLAWLAASAPTGERDGRYRRDLFAGIALCMVADFLLEFRAGFFLAGMAVFALGHLAFTAALLAKCRSVAIARLVPVFAYLAAVYLLIEPGLASMRVPVTIYMAVIGVMIWRAAAGLGTGGDPTPRQWLALGGAAVFGFSDTLIALDRFHAPIAGARIAIIVTYWAALWLLAASAARRLDDARE
ncbi:MAG: lysoplasmalogenase [Deltaproteobacteria bacterium]|nr:lysoplasmalogenase [Deltaproteobacteria bacterium]